MGQKFLGCNCQPLLVVGLPLQNGVADFSFPALSLSRAAGKLWSIGHAKNPPIFTVGKKQKLG
jgi:hypothetical protein